MIELIQAVVLFCQFQIPCDHQIRACATELYAQDVYTIQQKCFTKIMNCVGVKDTLGLDYHKLIECMEDVDFNHVS